jgi:hypothetical protein
MDQIPQNFDSIRANGAQEQSANVVRLSQVRADRAHQTEFDFFFSIIYPRRVRSRATRLREIAEEIEQHALTCDPRALDWLDTMVLCPIEREIEECKRLAARAKAWARERGGR